MDILKLEGVGAEVSGVDVGNLSDNEQSELTQLFSDEGLLLIRGQSIDEDQHISFARRFGDININRFFTPHPEHPEIALVTKEADQTVNIGGGWHTDHSYDVRPALGSILVARELPKAGGDTWFCSMYKAFESLSDGLKETLRGLNAVHSARHVFGTAEGYSREDATNGRIGNSAAADELTDPVHPVVIRHPLSGREALYVNGAFTRHFEGWTLEESEPLLGFLYAHAIAEENITRFHWEPGSIAFWDNRATWHFAQNDYHGERREMHRITIEGCALAAA